VFLAVNAEVGPSLAINTHVANSLAIIDPFFRIDPSTPNANLWSLEFSPGIVNAPPTAVPEPATWVFMLIGLATLVVIRRRSRSKFSPHGGF
jgi:hypothetical protein